MVTSSERKREDCYFLYKYSSSVLKIFVVKNFANNWVWGDLCPSVINKMHYTGA